MAAARRPLVAGNWKMNGLKSSLAELEKMIAAAGAYTGKVELMICPPAPLVALFAEKAKGSPIAIGAQDCHAQASGAFTGDVAAEMYKDAGAVAIIVGHSERRTYHKETDAEIRAKAEAAWRAGLIAIVCVGETKDERVGGKTLDVIGTQVAGSLPDGTTPENLVIAYEPVWAIGTGKTATPEQAQEVHAFIRKHLPKEVSGQIRILYGGSIKPGNIKTLMAQPDIDGGLVGGASLKIDSFAQIVKF